MATVKIDKFGGIVPRVAPSLLPDGAATVAHDLRLKSGKAVPLREPASVDSSEHTVYHENGLSDIGDARSVYCWKRTLANGRVRTDFLAFPGTVYFTHGNIADDKYDRIFLTGETGISFTRSTGGIVSNCPVAYLYNRSSNDDGEDFDRSSNDDGEDFDRFCICKEPMSAPRCMVKAGTSPSGVPEDSYAYFFLTWFDKYGYESPASGPSYNRAAGSASYDTKPLRYAQGATIQFQPVYVPHDAAGVRVYKTNSGDESANIQFIKEFTSGQLGNLENEFFVTVDDTQAGEVMPEIESPPFDLVDMIFVPGNYYAGRARSRPHTVLFSDVDNPTNWPTAFQYDVRDNIVKLAVTANSVFALTDGTPFVLSGTAPESMTVASLATPAACVSERSVVVYHNTVYFASNAGLFAIADGANATSSCVNLTDAYFTKEQWQALNPRSCIAGAFDGALHLFFTTSEGEKKSYIFDLTDGANALTTHDEAATCLCTDDRDDELYFVREV